MHGASGNCDSHGLWEGSVNEGVSESGVAARVVGVAVLIELFHPPVRCTPQERWRLQC
jgi:hypothetical protein